MATPWNTDREIHDRIDRDEFRNQEKKTLDVCPVSNIIQVQEEHMFKVEVIADGSGKWVGNAVTFGTVDLARAYGADLFSRWTAVREWRVVNIVTGDVIPMKED